jgi:hypothetical protein
LIARGLSFHDADAGHIIAVGTSVNQWLGEVKADLIDVLSSLLVVKSVHDKIEVLEELIAEPVLLDFTQICLNLYFWILFFNLLLESEGLGLVDVLSSE